MSICYIRAIDINKFLDICIEKQGTSRDQYEELLRAFDLFDQGKIV